MKAGSRIIEEAYQRIRESVPLENLSEDIRRNLAEVVGATLERMNVVTREEFEAELERLEEAKARIAALEERIERIERESAGGEISPGSATTTPDDDA